MSLPAGAIPRAQLGPSLSVVVPTEGRLQAIDALVTSMQEAWRAYAQTIQEKRTPAEVLELLFVDSTDPAIDSSTIAAWDASWMYVKRGTQNVRQKRNQGAAEAQGQWIAFVDSDCLVTPEYLGAV